MPFAVSGPARVLAAGIVTTFAGFPLIVGIEHPLLLELELRFTTDPDQPDVALRDAGQIGHRICWDLINFDGADGRGSATPVLLAETDDTLVYTHFRVFRYGRTADRTVHYTFYAVPKPSPSSASG